MQNRVKMRQIVSVGMVILFFVSLFSGCASVQNNLLDGFWMANKQNQYDYEDLGMDMGLDYGFLFQEEGKVLTPRYLLWSYIITENDGIEIYRVDSNGVQQLMFSGYYNKDNDTLVLSFTDESIDYYNLISLDCPSLVLTHYKDSEENALMKSLVFDMWYSYDSVISSVPITLDQKGFEIYSDYSDFRKTLAESYENLELYEFNYNMVEYDNFNVQQFHYYPEDEAWRFTPYYYRILNVNQIELMPAKNGVVEVYEYDGDFQLTNMATNQIIHRATYFAG